MQALHKRRRKLLKGGRAALDRAVQSHPVGGSMLDEVKTKTYDRRDQAATTERPRWEGSTKIYVGAPTVALRALAPEQSVPYVVGIRPRRIDPLSVFVWSVIGLLTMAMLVTVRTIVLIAAG